MHFSAEFVQKLGALARLELKEPTAEKLAGELSRILSYVEELSNIDATAGEATGSSPRREDLPVFSDPEPILQQSAGRQGRLVEVPPVKEES